MARTQTAAIAAAKSWIGKAYPAGWCQKWVVSEIFQSGGVGDWDGDGAADAEDGWKAAKKKVATTDAASVPAGYPIYFTGGGSDHGHAAVSAGGGYMYSTDRPYTGKVGKVPIKSVEPLWGVKFVGYVITDGNGNTFTDAPAAPTVPVWGKPETWVLNTASPDALRLGQRINAWNAVLGLPTWEPDDIFSSTEQKALSALQVAWGFGSDTSLGGASDGFPGAQTFAKLDETPTPVPEPVKPAPVVETISANLAGYDKVRGMANRIKRAQTTIPAYLAPKRPTWFHFQECAIDMLPVLDLKLPEYKRVGAGGKGRESYYRRDAGITIIEAALLNVEHMLLKDTKEHLVIAWEKDGHKAVDVNFHNENEGSTYQSVQLRDVMNHARDMADKHGIPHANILVTGDGNTKAASYLARLWGWTEAIYSAAKKIDLQYHSTNGWSGLSLGRRIDVDVTARSAEVLEAEQLFGAVIADHWPHRLKRRLVK